MSDTSLIDSILEKSSSYICVLDSSGKIIQINKRFSRLIGNLDRVQLIGKKAIDAVQGSIELNSFFTKLIEKASVDQNTEQIVQNVNRNSEKQIWIKFDITYVPSSIHGMCTFVVGTDISDEIIARKEAEQKTRERSSFLVRMGHELRTPLNTVLGYAQLLNGLEGMSELARDYISTIISNENNLLHLLNDVLELLKFESGQTTPLIVETNIKKLIQEVTTSYIDQFNSKFLSLTVEFRNEIPEAILTDPQKITQIVANMLGNALKFTRKGGVTVRVSFTNQLIIEIEDTGIGIETEEVPFLFEPFKQTAAEKEHMKGVGIGLAVARIFARMLGGDISLVRSSIGIGSLFKFVLNTTVINSSKPVVQQITDYSKITGISKPCKVLLVDDVDINLAMLEIFLAPAGFDVSIAANGFEAVEKFNSFNPDIVFMDLIMPEKDGFEATREIKSYNALVPVVALTASIVDSVKEQALESGVNDFMTKPFIPERLFEIISEHTGVIYTFK